MSDRDPVPPLTLTVVPGSFAACRLGPEGPIPTWAGKVLVDPDATFVSLTRTRAELSVVCPADRAPTDVQAEAPWRSLRVQGPLAFELTGILAALAGTLAAAGVPIFAISTYDTDYLLVKAANLARAVAALSTAGHRVEG